MTDAVQVGAIIASYYLKPDGGIAPTGTRYRIVSVGAAKVRTVIVAGELAGRSVTFDREHVPGRFLRVEGVVS